MAFTTRFHLVCECDGFECNKTIELPLDRAEEIQRMRNLFVIAKGCPTGPKATDKLVEKCDGYSLYADESAD